MGRNENHARLFLSGSLGQSAGDFEAGLVTKVDNNDDALNGHGFSRGDRAVRGIAASWNIGLPASGHQGWVLAAQTPRPGRASMDCDNMHSCWFQRLNDVRSDRR
jgi:hypothetical protein